jgi:hypothetical protein
VCLAALCTTYDFWLFFVTGCGLVAYFAAAICSLVQHDRPVCGATRFDVSTCLSVAVVAAMRIRYACIQSKTSLELEGI